MSGEKEAVLEKLANYMKGFFDAEKNLKHTIMNMDPGDSWNGLITFDTKDGKTVAYIKTKIIWFEKPVVIVRDRIP